MRWLFGVFFIVIAQPIYANDYQNARAYAGAKKNKLEQSLSNLNPNTLVSGYNPQPKESRFNHNALKETAKRDALKNEIAQDAINRVKNRKEIDLEEEGRAVDKGIDLAQKQNINGIPCSNGKCLPTNDEKSTDFAQGATQMGALGGVADEVRKNQVRKGVPAIFPGNNNLCRIAAFHVGNCCGGNAHLLRCRAAEKALSRAKQDNRAVYVGTFCAHRELGKCIEYKQSWCVFPTKLSSIIQIQGRFGQLGIKFGQTTKNDNYANCRGIKPEEIARIDFKRLDMSPLTNEFKNKYQPQNTQQQDRHVSGQVGAWGKNRKWHEKS